MTQACSRIVRRDDPQLYATAMMAKEPERSRLMVLYAFDVELSRAAQASNEPMVARVRLQWWRDVVNAAVRGDPVEEHEVAQPLAELIAANMDDTGLLDAMIDGHERELDAPFDSRAHGTWADERFGARLCYAINALVSPKAAVALGTRIGHGDAVDPSRTPAVTRHILPLGRALAAAFAIEHAERRARAGLAPFLAGISGEEISALGRGELLDSLRDEINHLADRYARQIAFSRENFDLPSKKMIPALLPLRRAERILEIARSPDFRLRQLHRVDRPFNGLRLGWTASRGRW